jgi:excisionase family DNA binding protein
MSLESIKFELPMSPKQVAEIFFGGQFTYGTILNMAKANEMPFHKIRGRYLIWPDELVTWMTKVKGGDTNDRDAPA